MREFNLAEALAGKPLCTRCGYKVLEFHLWSDRTITARVRNSFGIITLYAHTSQGKLDGGGHTHEHYLDLMMGAETKTYWFNVYRHHGSPNMFGSIFFETKEEAEITAKKIVYEVLKIAVPVEVEV